MKTVYIVTLTLLVLTTCVGCAEVDSKNALENYYGNSNSTDTYEGYFNNLKEKAKSDAYFFQAQEYDDAFDMDNTDMVSYYNALENYEKSIEILMSDEVNTQLYYKDIGTAYNNMGLIQSKKWQQDKVDDELLDLSIENYEKAFYYYPEDPVISKNLGNIYYYKWCRNYDDIKYRDLSLSYLEVSYSINPNRYATNSMLGLYYITMWEQSGYDEQYYNLAEEYLKTSIELNSEYSTAIENLEYLYLEKAKLDIDTIKD